MASDYHCFVYRVYHWEYPMLFRSIKSVRYCYPNSSIVVLLDPFGAGKGSGVSASRLNRLEKVLTSMGCLVVPVDTPDVASGFVSRAMRHIDELSWAANLTGKGTVVFISPLMLFTRKADDSHLELDLCDVGTLVNGKNEVNNALYWFPVSALDKIYNIVRSSNIELPVATRDIGSLILCLANYNITRRVTHVHKVTPWGEHPTSFRDAVSTYHYPNRSEPLHLSRMLEYKDAFVFPVVYDAASMRMTSREMKAMFNAVIDRDMPSDYTLKREM